MSIDLEYISGLSIPHFILILEIEVEIDGWSTRNQNPLLIPLRLGWIREAATTSSIDPAATTDSEASTDIEATIASEASTAPAASTTSADALASDSPASPDSTDAATISASLVNTATTSTKSSSGSVF